MRGIQIPGKKAKFEETGLMNAVIFSVRGELLAFILILVVRFYIAKAHISVFPGG